MPGADFPLAGHSETVSKILSTVLPPRSYTYFVAFLPGFFFEVLICLGNPPLIQQLIGRSNQAANLGRYPKILVAVFLAFVLGQAFMLWTNLVYRILEQIFRIARHLWQAFCKWLLLPFLNGRMRAQGWWSRRRLLHAAIMRVQRDAFGDWDSEGLRKLWAVIIRSLYEKHYGIDLTDLRQEEWNALYQAQTGLPMIRFGDHMFMIAIQAIGWSGLAAIRLAPVLIDRRFVVFSIFFVGIGMLYQWQLIRSLQNEYTFGLLRVRALIRELRKRKPVEQVKGEHPANG